MRLNVASPPPSSAGGSNNNNVVVRRLQQQTSCSPAPSLQSPTASCYSDDIRQQMTTFSPEPSIQAFGSSFLTSPNSSRPSSVVSDSIHVLHPPRSNIPPSISENEELYYQNCTRQQQPQSSNSNTLVAAPKRYQRPTSLCDSQQVVYSNVYGTASARTSNSRPQRPTTLFKNEAVLNSAYIQPNRTNKAQRCYGNEMPVSPCFSSPGGSEMGEPTSESSNCSTSTTGAAQIRPHGLSRRTSFRTGSYHKVPIPVAAPLSPVGPSECSYDIKSPDQVSSLATSPQPPSCISPTPPSLPPSHYHAAGRYCPPLPENQAMAEFISPEVTTATAVVETARRARLAPHAPTNRLPPMRSILPFHLQDKSAAYESLKSHLSTSSHDSTGSKNTVSSGSDLNTSSASCNPQSPPPQAAAAAEEATAEMHYISEEGSEDVDSPSGGLLKSLTFVSPKSGVYRPMADNRRRQQNCSIM